MRKLDWKRLKKASEAGFAIIAGNMLLGFAVAAFILPSGVIMGGATGVGVVLARFIPLDTAVIVLCVNLLALALGWAVLGWRFVLATVASSLLYPIFLGAAQRVPDIDGLTADPLLSALLGGGLVGIAVGLVMRVGSSTGGTDVVNLALHQWTHIPVSVAVYLTDIVIMGAQAVFSDPEQILYGVVLLVVETIVLDKVMLLGQSQIQLFVVSSRYEEIRQKCLTKLQAGITMIQIETGRTRLPQRGVLCVIPPRKLYAAQSLIQSVDPHAFLTITQIKEVRGQGFSSERVYVEPPESPTR
ncbi:YitT family protein [Acutalibacter intestini]|uniref:YitT family protein n=1 Tax=Acutalibacter intestini TaxID=3093659 RepID=UPI002AC9C6C1|nr:YitT family protein [Acutalibacter sp. M00204]